MGPGVFAADQDTGTVSGFVVVEVGSGNPKPVANAEVRLTFGSKSDTRRTGPDGKYSFVELLPGKYTVKVSAPDGMKTRGDGAETVTLDGDEVERADFVLVSTEKEKPTPTPAPKATVTPSPKPASNQGVAAAPVGLMPALVVPYASPSPPLPGAQARANHEPGTSQQATPQSGIPASLASSIGAAVHPSPIVSGTPGLIFAIGSPTPQANPTGTRTPTTGEEVLASGPPRRLITSFEALRETGNGGAAAQLKSWATETSLVLGVPFRTQIDGTTFSLVNCGPASLSMVLAAFGLDIDPPSVRDYLNSLVGNYDPDVGTSLYVLARIAREAGLNTFGTSSGLQGWTMEAIREQIRAGHPVITLTKYRFLPGHFGSVTDFEHYIVITGLAGEDFVYNDGAFSTEYGYNLLISPAQLQRAWAASSVPGHAVAIGFGDSLRPLPIVPNRLTAANLVSGEMSEEEFQAVVEAPVRVHRAPAAEWLREQTLDLLGARTTLVDGEPLGQVALFAPPTRLDPSEAAVQEHPTGAALTTSYERPPADPATDGVNAAADAVADARDPGLAAGASPADARLVPPSGGEGSSLMARIAPLGLALIGAGLLLLLGGGVACWQRGKFQLALVRTLAASSAWRADLARRLPKRR